MSGPSRPAVLLPLAAVTVAAAGLVVALLNRDPGPVEDPESAATLAQLIPTVSEPLSLITATEPGGEASLVRWSPGEVEPDRTPIGIDAHFALWSHAGERALVLTRSGDLVLVSVDGSTRMLAAGVGTVAWHAHDPSRIAYTTPGSEPELVTARIGDAGLTDRRPRGGVPAAARVIAWNDDRFVLVDTRGSGGVLWLDPEGSPTAHLPGVLAAAAVEHLLVVPIAAADVDPSWGELPELERFPTPAGPVVTDLAGAVEVGGLPDAVAGEAVVWGLIDRDGDRVALGARGGDGVGFRVVEIAGDAGPLIGPIRGRPVGFGAGGAVFVIDVGGGELVLADRAAVEVDLGISGVAGLAP